MENLIFHFKQKPALDNELNLIHLLILDWVQKKYINAREEGTLILHNGKEYVQLDEAKFRDAFPMLVFRSDVSVFNYLKRLVHLNYLSYIRMSVDNTNKIIRYYGLGDNIKEILA